MLAYELHVHPDDQHDCVPSSQIHYGRDDCDTSIQTSIAILIGVVVILVMMMIIITTKRNRKMRVTKQPINFLGSKETYTTQEQCLYACGMCLRIGQGQCRSPGSAQHEAPLSTVRECYAKCFTILYQMGDCIILYLPSWCRLTGSPLIE